MTLTDLGPAPRVDRAPAPRRDPDRLLLARLQPPPPRVFETLEYVPTPRQQIFHDATEFDVLYGGAAGGGKSKALVMEGLRACVQYPGIRVIAFRRTYPELEESLLTELANVSYAQALGARYNKGSHDLRFANGSLFMFRYARNMADATMRQGGQFQLLMVDELALMPPEVVAFLSSRLRSGNPRIPVLGIRCGSNPGGVGHGTVRQKYVTGTKHGAETYRDKRGRTVRFIPAKVDDNPHLNAEYLHDLDALPEQMRAAFKDGSWDSFEGQAFAEWKTGRILVPRFELPASWKRYGGMDYGWTSPSAYLEIAQDQDGRLWVYRELTMRKTPELDQARKILQGSECRARWADPAMWGQTGSALPVAKQMATVGLALREADNDRLGGKARVHTYLAEAPACGHHRQLGWATCPMLHVLDGTAPEFVRTMPDLPLDEKNVEDVDTDAEDHHYDAFRYAVMGIGAAPRFVDDQPKPDGVVPADDRKEPWAHGFATGDDQPPTMPDIVRRPTGRQNYQP